MVFTGKKKILLLVFFLFSVAPNWAYSANQGAVTYENADFSYQLPAGWQLGEMPGVKYKLAYTTPVKDFAPNINVVDEKYNGPLADYVALNIKALGAAFQDFNKISLKYFKTDTNIAAGKLVTENTQQGKRLHQVFYIFEGGDKKLIATCTQLVGDTAAIDKECDKSMLTFKIK